MQITTGVYSATITTALPYVLYLPDSYDANNPDQTYPVMMFLHGAGERGNHNLPLLRSVGLPKYIEALDDDFPFIVIAPQCPPDSLWSAYPQALITALDSVIRNYHVDERRVYLTGLSMGGFGTWFLASSYPSRFAAIAPICGFGYHLLGFPNRLKRITHIPVWAFHGEADDIVPIEEQKMLVDAFRNYGGNVQWTTYPNVNHNSWDKAYATADLYSWFLEHTL